jgi:hypothetical protein
MARRDSRRRDAWDWRDRTLMSVLALALAISSIFPRTCRGQDGTGWPFPDTTVSATLPALVPFPRDQTGHRFTRPNPSITLAPHVARLVATVLRSARTGTISYCIVGHPTRDGLMIDSLTSVDSTTKSICREAKFVGGLAVLAHPSAPPHSHGEMIEAWLERKAILASRPDFVVLITVDTLLATGPHLQVTPFIPTPLDTAPPMWRKQS